MELESGMPLTNRIPEWNRVTRFIVRGLALLVVLAGNATARETPDIEAFAREMAQRHGFDAAQVESMLAGAERRQDIIDAISRPAESKPWYQYRPIFLTPTRIGGGVEFWNNHEALIEEASRRFGVDPEVIVAIVGVETRYGEITGGYRVLDALYTLAFHYPPRGDFFRGELEQLLLLSREESVSPTEIMGSYAGAMGHGQFIPSSYRAYAVDFDGDGARSLWETPDAVGSVANYLSEHGWKKGERVAVRATAAPNARPLPDASLKPEHTVGELARRGFEPEVAVDAGDPATLIALEQPDATEYWIGFHNFYVISRYNRSALYSMAVHQLSRAIVEAREYQAGQEAP